MKGLILKDFINLKKSVKLFVILIVIYGFMAVSSGDGSFFSTIFTVLVAVLTLSVYSYDESAHWDSFALTLPVTKELFVLEKYVIMILLTAIGVVIGMLFGFALYLTGSIDKILPTLTSCAVGAAVAIIFYSIIIPFVIKLGVEKSRILLFAVYIIPFAITVLVSKALKAGSLQIPTVIIDIAKTSMKYAYVIVPAILIIALIISYMISVNIFRKKEF